MQRRYARPVAPQDLCAEAPAPKRSDLTNGGGAGQPATESRTSNCALPEGTRSTPAPRPTPTTSSRGPRPAAPPLRAPARPAATGGAKAPTQAVLDTSDRCLLHAFKRAGDQNRLARVRETQGVRSLPTSASNGLLRRAKLWIFSLPNTWPQDEAPTARKRSETRATSSGRTGQAESHLDGEPTPQASCRSEDKGTAPADVSDGAGPRNAGTERWGRSSPHLTGMTHRTRAKRRRKRARHLATEIREGQREGQIAPRCTPVTSRSTRSRKLQGPPVLPLPRHEQDLGGSSQRRKRPNSTSPYQLTGDPLCVETFEPTTHEISCTKIEFVNCELFLFSPNMCHETCDVF